MSSVAFYALIIRVSVYTGLLIIVPIIAGRSLGESYDASEKKKINNFRLLGIIFMVIVEVLIIANPIGRFF